ncbi:tetratricopeptide repeat protein [Acidobacteriota bacterium]
MQDKAHREILESWKEIADHLNRDVKTCRRWELNLELPVRRLDGTPRARVFAYKDEIDLWLEDKLNNKDTSTTRYLRIPKKKKRILWIIPSAIIFFVIITVAAFRILPRINIGSFQPEKPHLAVLPIKNYTGDETLAHLHDALTELVISDLFQSKYITVETVERMNYILEKIDKVDTDTFTTEDLKKLSSFDGITHFLNATVMKFGEKIRLDIAVLEAGSGKAIWRDQIEGDVDDTLVMVDALTKNLKPHLNLTKKQIANDFDEAVEKVTTPNRRAFEFYIEAKKAFNLTEWNLAIELFRKATALDPDFAMAYRFLSGVYNHLGLETREDRYWDKMREYGQMAKEAVQRRTVSERERLIIEGLGKSVQHEIETYKKLLELYPDDDYGNYRLGVRYAQGEAYDMAEKHLKRISGTTNQVFTFLWLGNIYLDQARYDEAEELFELSLERFPQNWFSFHWMAKLCALQQKFDEALIWCDRGYDLDPIQFRDSMIRGDVLFFKGDFSDAEKEYRLCLNSEIDLNRQKAAGRLLQLYKTQGRFEDAQIQAEETLPKLIERPALISDPIYYELALQYAGNGNLQTAFNLCDRIRDPRIHFKLRGEIYALTNQWSKAEEILREIEQAIENSNTGDFASFMLTTIGERPYSKRLKNVLYSLEARIALENGNYKLAIDYVEKAKSLYCGINLIPAELIDISGKAYYLLRDLESAREQFEWISRMTFNRIEYGDIYARNFYRLGKIFEETGNQAKARENYTRFINLWKDADPGSPEVIDVRSRLNGQR